MGVASAVAGFVVWLGASVLVLSDGRRGVALAVGLAGAGLSFLAWAEAGAAAGALILVSTVVSAGTRLRNGHDGWLVMPAGSTPRLILCIAAGLLSLWIAASVTSGDQGAVRYAVFVAMVLAGGRVVTALDRSVIVGAAGVLALAVAVAAGLASPVPGIAPFVAGAAVAAGTALIRSPAPNVA